MHEYDIALKAVLSKESAILRALAGGPIAKWLNPELGDVRSRRVDLLGERADGGLVHVELQSVNERQMAMRMADYSLAIFRQFGRFPAQTVLYVGEAPLRMQAGFEAPGFAFRCRMVDIREFDGEELIGSEQLEDNVVAILAKLGDRRAAVRRILERISAAAAEVRAAAMAELAILVGLRSLGTVLESEAKNMPILNDIMDHELFGREFRRGDEAGFQRGVRRGEANVLVRQIERRFGSVPGWVNERLERMEPEAIEEASLRLLDATTLDAVFPR